MDNIDIKELLEKVKQYEQLKQEKEKIIKQLLDFQEFLNSLSADKTQNFAFEPDFFFFGCFKYSVLNLLDQNYQAKALAQERKEYLKEYLEQKQTLFRQLRYEQEELTKAWEEFRSVKTKKYQQTLKEIYDKDL